MADYLSLLFQTLLSFLVLLVLAKLIGYRQISQMSMFDYINGITIGSIAAEMATELESNWTYPLTAMVLYGIFTWFMALANAKSIKARRLLTGRPLVLLNNGTFYRENLKKGRITLNDFLEECRENGYFCLSDLQTAILESNGKISFIPKAEKKPLTPEDMQLQPEQEYIDANLIMDGQLLDDNLKHAGRDMDWLHTQLKAHGLSDPSQVFFAAFHAPDELVVFPMEGKKQPPDILT